MNNTNCNSCNFCDSCDSCDSCNDCDYCDSCDSCNDCDYCRNLKMTEYNYFCWSEKVNDENSFQQKRYRVFNTEVSKDEYVNIKKIYHKIELNSSDDYEVRFQNGFRKMWNTLSKEEKQEYLDIPHFDMKGFTFITGITEDDIKDLKTGSLSGKEVEVIVNGTTYTAIIK